MVADIKDAQRIMNDFVRLGAMVDVMFLFNSYLVADHVPQEEVKQVLNEYKDSIKKTNPGQHKIFVEGCDRFEEAVENARKVINVHAHQSDQSPSPKID